jgi:hypothetical protein
MREDVLKRRPEGGAEMKGKRPIGALPACEPSQIAEGDRSAAAVRARKPAVVRALHWLGVVLGNDYLRTFIYLNLIHRPRAALRNAIFSFYRFDILYSVIDNFARTYHGPFSILEFGTSDGYAFTKMLFATRYLQVADRITVHGFDTFEGLPPPDGVRDQTVVGGRAFFCGQYRGRYEALSKYCAGKYRNWRLHKGLFSETLTDEFLTTLLHHKPILIWIDCDYYSSTRSVFERLIRYLPSGCVFYFDDFEINFGSRLTGEACAVHEINSGVFGDRVELVLDPELSMLTRRCYRFVNLDAPTAFRRLAPKNSAGDLRPRTNDSPLP